MSVPKHALQDVLAAVTAKGCLTLGRKACYDRLLGSYDPQEGVFSTEDECRAFARDVLLLLRPDDYAQSLSIPDTSRRPTTYGNEDYDVYGVRLDAATLAKHGLTSETTWYVKFTVRQQKGRKLFCLSLHRLEKSLLRVGGWLHPAW
jgi:hypothetical protein